MTSRLEHDSGWMSNSLSVSPLQNSWARSRPSTSALTPHSIIALTLHSPNITKAQLFEELSGKISVVPRESYLVRAQICCRLCHVPCSIASWTQMRVCRLQTLECRQLGCNQNYKGDYNLDHTCNRSAVHWRGMPSDSNGHGEAILSGTGPLRGRQLGGVLFHRSMWGLCLCLWQIRWSLQQRSPSSFPNNARDPFYGRETR